MCGEVLLLLKHRLSWRRQGSLAAPGADFANNAGNLSVNSYSETNPASLLQPDLPSVSAVFCQRRSAAPSAAQVSNCVHVERHKGITTPKLPLASSS